MGSKPVFTFMSESTGSAGIFARWAGSSRVEKASCWAVAAALKTTKYAPLFTAWWQMNCFRNAASDRQARLQLPLKHLAGSLLPVVIGQGSTYFASLIL